MKPRYAIVSTWNRRDLQQPLEYFERLDVAHFYRVALADQSASELGGAIRYTHPLDLLLKLVRARPDVLQGLEPLGILPLPYVLVGWLYAAARGVPLVVVSLENRPLETKYGRAVAAAVRAILRPYLRSAHVIFYLNEGTRRNLVAAGAPAERLVGTMYGTWGVDTAEFTPEGLAHHEPGWERYLLFIGRVQAFKGIFDLVDAFARLAPRHRGLGLLIVGDGPDAPRLVERAEGHGLGERVRLVGTVLNRDLPPYLRGAAAVVSPSTTTRGWEEQVGMVNIQAMACGTPVVSTLSGAIPEYVDHGLTGLLVPEHDPAALADAIDRILSDPAVAARLGAAGRAQAVERFDARRNVERVETLLIERCQLRTPP